MAEPPPYEFKKLGGSMLAVPAPGSFSVSKRERRDWARAETHAFSGWPIRCSATAVVLGACYLALSLLGSEAGPVDQLVVAGATAAVTLGLFPAVEYIRNYIRAGEKIAIAKARELEIEVAAQERRLTPHSLLEAEVLHLSQQLRAVLTGHESLDKSSWEVVSPWVARLFCTLQEFGRHSLAQELHVDDNVPQSGDERGQRVYIAERLADLDRILERLRESGFRARAGESVAAGKAHQDSTLAGHCEDLGEEIEQFLWERHDSLPKIVIGETPKDQEVWIRSKQLNHNLMTMQTFTHRYEGRVFRSLQALKERGYATPADEEEMTRTTSTGDVQRVGERLQAFGRRLKEPKV